MELRALTKALIAFFILGSVVHTHASQRISCSNSGPNTVTCRIDEPNVGQRMTDYPSIQFQQGSLVIIDAGGCVQTGGIGNTWKRYVDPQGPNSDRLYHGLVEIPGATQGLVRIQAVIKQSLRASSGHLRLGFEDDDYDGNGYSKHDDGTGDQCKNVGPAWVLVTIVATGRSPIDQKYEELGGNGSFLGQPSSGENAAPDGTGHYRHYQNGSIYWSPETGAHEVHGLIRDKWARLGWERGFLGYPLIDETSTPDSKGRYNHFQGGSIYWEGGATEAFEVHGDIRAKWEQIGWEKGFLGYPITDESSTPDLTARFNKFERGSIYWIYEPNVRWFSTDFREIRFKGGSRVIVDAHGCVQTGGIGSTWKDYVYPSGPNSDRMYHGLIWIPGVTQCLVRIKDFLAANEVGRGHTLWVSNDTGDSVLRLGYEDDNYSDNGYSNFDEGTEHQCLGQSHAIVTLVVEENPSSPPNPLPHPNVTCAVQPSTGSTGGSACTGETTATFALARQTIVSGPIPYVGTYPGIGSINGNVSRIENRSGFQLHLPKAGRSTQDCDNASAVVVLNPNAGTTSNDLQGIYGNTNPPLPIPVVACVAGTTALPDSVLVRITYACR